MEPLLFIPLLSLVQTSFTDGIFASSLPIQQTVIQEDAQFATSSKHSLFTLSTTAIFLSSLDEITEDTDAAGIFNTQSRPTTLSAYEIECIRQGRKPNKRHERRKRDHDTRPTIPPVQPPPQPPQPQQPPAPPQPITVVVQQPSAPQQQQMPVIQQGAPSRIIVANDNGNSASTTIAGVLIGVTILVSLIVGFCVWRYHKNKMIDEPSTEIPTEGKSVSFMTTSEDMSTYGGSESQLKPSFGTIKSVASFPGSSQAGYGTVKSAVTIPAHSTAKFGTYGSSNPNMFASRQ